MFILLPIILLVVFFACVGFLYNEGMWSNAVRLVNVITAGLLAMNFFEPLAGWLTDWGDSMHTYIIMWDYLALWGLFALFVIVFRELTSRVSQVKVRFLKVIDRIGSGAFAALIGWVMVCFTLASFHAAPLAKNFLGGAFQPRERMFLVGPDRLWLSFMQSMSNGTYCRYPDPEVFGARVDYVSQQEEKRAQYEEYVPRMKSLLINPQALSKTARPPEKPVEKD